MFFVPFTALIVVLCVTAQLMMAREIRRFPPKLLPVLGWMTIQICEASIAVGLVFLLSAAVPEPQQAGTILSALVLLGYLIATHHAVRKTRGSFAV